MKVAAMIGAALALARGSAHADPPRSQLDVAYLYDGGAVELFWLPLVGAIAIDQWLPARSTPLWFSAHEGGARRASWEIPAWSVTAASAGLGLAMIAGGDDARWVHVKGLAEAMASSALVVSILKPAFGRHRPDWTADSSDATRDTSFPSGHATNAFLLASYGALYLHAHVFDGHGATWWQGATYAGLYASAALIAAERVVHHRHHVSDVVAGALLGTATAAAMFCYQERRLRTGADRGWAVVPSIERDAVTIAVVGGLW